MDGRTDQNGKVKCLRLEKNLQILECGERLDRWTDGLTYQPTWQVVESLLTNLFLSHLRSTDAYADINACADEEDDKTEEDEGDKRDKAY